jgi:Homeodomain-like domain
LSAEVLFLRKQLAFYQEHQVQPRKLTDAARFSLALWCQLFNWRAALLIVQPETLIGWHRQGFKLFWRWKSRLGRPRIPETLRQLIVRMVQENPTWGEERIAAELSVKLGILVSPRTVRAYWPQDRDPRGGRRTSSQHWRTFVRNHAKAIVAADFLVAITAGFRVLYVFVVMEVGSRRILHCNVTAHPTAAWTLQQFREAIPKASNCWRRARLSRTRSLREPNALKIQPTRCRSDENMPEILPEQIFDWPRCNLLILNAHEVLMRDRGFCGPQPRESSRQNVVRSEAPQ